MSTRKNEYCLRCTSTICRPTRAKYCASCRWTERTRRARAGVAPAWKRFEARFVPEPNSGCWLWFGALSDTGYGSFNVGAGQYQGAHKFSYERVHGKVPAGIDLDHLCRVRCCVNPEHLEPVTPTVNILRGESPMAMNARKTHCVRGHAFDERNTYLAKTGWRGCRRCHADSQLRRFHRSKRA